jgi:hypothetical protein
MLNALANFKEPKQVSVGNAFKLRRRNILKDIRKKLGIGKL